jgi:nucleotide-binding universal stress UspA family protein
MKKILVAVDGSSSSISAAKKALTLSNALGAQVTLIHVAPPTIIAGDLPVAPSLNLREADLAQGAEILKTVSSALSAPSLPSMNLWGSPADLIAETASNQNFDLVVAGSKGRNAISRALLGSVSDRLVHLCQKPVLVVPSRSK